MSCLFRSPCVLKYVSELIVCVLYVQKVEEEVELVKGSHVRVVTAESDTDKTDGKIIWLDYPNLSNVLQKGGKIYIDDGLIGLRVLEIGTTRWIDLPPAY